MVNISIREVARLQTYPAFKAALTLSAFLDVFGVRAYSSVWLERTPDKREVGGSNPPRPTKHCPIKIDLC